MTDKEFQYMLLLRGATQPGVALNAPKKFQYMLLSRGATGIIDTQGIDWILVSIHAPLARSNFHFSGIQSI